MWCFEIAPQRAVATVRFVAFALPAFPVFANIFEPRICETTAVSQPQTSGCCRERQDVPERNLGPPLWPYSASVRSPACKEGLRPEHEMESSAPPPKKPNCGWPLSPRRPGRSPPIPNSLVGRAAASGGGENGSCRGLRLHHAIPRGRTRSHRRRRRETPGQP